MNFLDVRTIMFSHIITDAICTAVAAFLWLQNRKRFAGTAYWLFDFAFQTAAASLIVLRGSIPDWISMIFSNTLVIAGALLGYMGLARFVGKKSAHIHNYILLTAFVAVHAYFVFIQPNLAARNLNVSLGLLIVCSQCVWLVLRRVEHGMRRIMREVGVVFGIFCLVSLIRVAVVLVNPAPGNDFFQSGLYDTLLLMAYQILLILLAFALALMVNRRLLVEIQTQEEKFSKAFRSSPYALTLTRASDGRILEVNDGFVTITGYAYSEVIGKTTLDLQLWDREEDRIAVVGELSKGNRVLGKEFQFRTKSGEMITGLFSAEIVTIHDQPWVLSSISDVTERVRAEAEAEHQASFPRLNPHPILEVDTSGAIAYCNSATMKVLSILGQESDARVFLPLDMVEMLQDLAQQKETLFYREVTVNDATFGEYIHLVPEFNVARIYASDITERVRNEAVRQRAEEALRESEERYRTVADYTYDWEYWSAPNGKIIYISPSCERITGYRAEEFIADPDLLDAIVYPDDSHTFEQHKLSAGLDDHQRDVHQTDLRIIRRDGQVCWIGHICQIIRRADGTSLGRRATNRDISERKRAEEMIRVYSENLEQMVAARTRSLEEAQEKLVRQEKLAVLGQLSGSIAHELRTPLGAIKNAVYLLNMILENSDANAREVLGILERQIKTSEGIINNLLDFARTRQPARQPVDVNQAVEQALSHVDVPDGVTVQHNLADLPPIAADPGQLGQILGNLLLNAVQAMPDGGALTLRTYLPQPDWVAISVADTGVGIPPENLDKLFEPLFTTKAKGIGLGLALVKMLVEGHGGAIRVESVVGQGTTFTVELPTNERNYSARLHCDRHPERSETESKGLGVAKAEIPHFAPLVALVPLRSE